MLAHQLRALPDFEYFWTEVPVLFAWLNGEEQVEELQPIPLSEDEHLWTPPPTFWASGPGSLLDPVRFAAVNRLLVDLGYNGQHRRIEPYSLRRTRASKILLHAIRADSGENRSYRIDRIQSVTVTNHPFTPRFVVEFPVAGAIPAPPSRRRRSARRRLT